MFERYLLAPRFADVPTGLGYDRFHPAVCGRSAVGSAEPCQGSGRRFEPGRPLSKSYKVSSAKAKLGRMAERRGSGLQIPLHGFKSRSDLQSLKLKQVVVLK